MPSRNEATRARTRLEQDAPISNDGNLLKLREQVADIVREAKLHDQSDDELVSTVVDAVARFYFRHAILKRRRGREG